MSIPEVDPEHESVEAFVEFCMEDEQTTFTHEDLGQIGFALHGSRQAVRIELEGYGLTLAKRAPQKRTRGFTTSSNDRYFGPGSEKMHGGSGWEQINGFAGRKG